MEGLITAIVLGGLLLLLWTLRRHSKPSLLQLFSSLKEQPLMPFVNYTYIDRPQELKWLVSQLRSQPAIGVDLEHCAQGYQGQVCLMQISASQDFIIDVLALREHMQAMRPIFENAVPVKVMHGAYNDVKWLFESFGFKVSSLYDTQQAHKLTGQNELGLDRLWGKYCGFIMDRSQKKEMQGSDWSVRPLSASQLEYAAIDSHFLLYLQQVTWTQLNPLQRTKFLEKSHEIAHSWAITDTKRKLKKYEAGMDSATFGVLKELLDLREEVARAEDINPRKLIPTKVLAELAQMRPTSLQDYAFPFLESHSAKVLKMLLVQQSAVKAKKDHLSRKEIKKQRFEQFVAKFSVKKDIYENCRMLAPDGEVLCFCDHKKANWYVERGIAEVVSEGPLTIKLKFEPNGRGFSDLSIDQASYMKEKQNVCVVCGSSGFFQRYHVVPMLYRQFFPLEMKSHRSHDIVLLCPHCHKLANTAADKMIRILSSEYAVPAMVQSENQSAKTSLIQVSKKARTLAKAWDTLAVERRSELIDEVKGFFDKQPLYTEHMTIKFGGNWLEDKAAHKYLSCSTDEVLKVLGDINWNKEAVNLHGKLVIQQLTDINAFSYRWRRHFVAELQPKFLSDAWRADIALNF
jgi:cation-transporting P-type ATPase D